jgi:hypothetical protein
MADFQGKPGNQDNKSIPFNNGLSISHAPLNLDGSAPTRPEPVSIPAPAPAPAAAPPAPPVIDTEERPISKDSGKKVSWPDRITGMKTFFTKLHAGAIEFLEDQISRWLAENPGVKIKLTNVVIGEVQAKKTEANVIITVWY